MMKGNFDRFGEFDEYAALAAKRLAAIDRNRLAGGDAQFVAVIHSAIMEAMVYGHAKGQADGEVVYAGLSDFFAGSKSVSPLYLRGWNDCCRDQRMKSAAIAHGISADPKAGIVTPQGEGFGSER